MTMPTYRREINWVLKTCHHTSSFPSDSHGPGCRGGPVSSHRDWAVKQNRCTYMMKKNTHEETLPESAKKTSVKVAPTCRASLHGSVSKAAAAEHTPYVRTQMWHHMRCAAQTIERRGFPAGLLLCLAWLRRQRRRSVTSHSLDSRGGRPATACSQPARQPHAGELRLEDTLSPWQLGEPAHFFSS